MYNFPMHNFPMYDFTAQLEHQFCTIEIVASGLIASKCCKIEFLVMFLNAVYVSNQLKRMFILTDPEKN